MSWLGFSEAVAPGLGQGLGAGFAQALGGGAAPPAAPALSSADGGGVTVNVGGMNVPAYPDFPRMQTGTKTSTPDPVNSLVTDSRFYWLAGAVVAAVFLKKVIK